MKFQASDLNGVAGYLKSQVQAAMRQRKITKRLKALRALSKDTQLNAVWLAMFSPLDTGAIPHFKHPANARIIDLADESGYGLDIPIDAGHPFSNETNILAVSLLWLHLNQRNLQQQSKRQNPGTGP